MHHKQEKTYMMTKYILTLIAAATALTSSLGQEGSNIFDQYFCDQTLRIDYTLAGTAEQQAIYLDHISEIQHWAGRRVNMDKLLLKGNGQVTVRDIATGKVIYTNAFSTLFSEWLSERAALEDAGRSFEHTVLVPRMKEKATIEVNINDNHGKSIAYIKHTIDPSDILIEKLGQKSITPHRYLWKGGDSQKAIDIAIVAEGYTQEEEELYYHDAQTATDALLAHEPFKSMKERLNIVAAFSVSEESGVSIPRLNEWKRTALGSHFSTFYSDRYLTTLNVKKVHNALAGIDYEHIIILANTDEYGGGGIFNSYTLTTAHHPMFRPVVVHEFGHSFGGLADEYYYTTEADTTVYTLNIEPWEPNITTLVNFDSKWRQMLDKNASIPTRDNDAQKVEIGVIEGAGYSGKGIYRPSYNCRMRTNEHETFCPVCIEALKKMILFYTE